MEMLQEFIRTTRDARELKRALAVQNTVAGRPRADVAAELGCAVAFVDKWRWIYDRQGVAGLRLGYKGSTGYLTPPQKAEICTWIQAQSTWDVGSLEAYIAQGYHIRYKSKKSYYALLKAAKMSWKKSQDDHPDADPKDVETTREVIKKNAARGPRPYPETDRHADGR